MTSTWTLRMSNIKKFLFALQLRLHVRKMPVLKMMLQLLQSYDRYCLFEHSPNFSLCFLRKQLLFIPDNKHIHSRMYFKTFIKMHTLVIPLALWKPTYFTGNFFFLFSVFLHFCRLMQLILLFFIQKSLKVTFY